MTAPATTRSRPVRLDSTRTRTVGALLLSWFFYAYPAEMPSSVVTDLRVERHGPFATLAACDVRAMELERLSRWRLRAGACFPVVTEDAR